MLGPVLVSANPHSKMEIFGRRYRGDSTFKRSELDRQRHEVSCASRVVESKTRLRRSRLLKLNSDDAGMGA